MSKYDGTTLTGSYRPGGYTAANYGMPAPTGYSAAGYPATGSVSGYPASGSVSGYPASGSVSGYPASGSVSGYPASGSVSGYPTSGSVSGYSASGPRSVSGYPKGSSTSGHQGYAGSVSSYPASGAQPVAAGSTSSYPTTQSTYPAATTGSQDAADTYAKPTQSTTSYPPSTYNAGISHQRSVAPSQYSTATGMKSLAAMNASRMVRRSPPPKMRPWMIIFVTMAVGLLFIGIVLTIVAHWPGFTSIGVDPLEYVGPVLLAVGGAGVITAIVTSIVLSNFEKEEFQEKVAKFKQSQRSLYASRMTMQSAGSVMLGHDPMMTSDPNGGPITSSRAPSTASQLYAGGSNMSYEHESENSGGKYEVYKVDGMPDPNADGSQVPQPVRTRTRDTKKKVTASAADPSALGRNSPLAGAGALVSGPGTPGAPAHLNESGTSLDLNPAFSALPDPNAEAAGQERKKKRKEKSRGRREKQAEALLGAAAAPSNTSPPHGNGNNGYHGDGDGGFNEPLRIAIRTQPGAQVHIRPSASELHNQSAETEI